ncbi:MAG TPA: hypothetical protein VGB85_02270 [Nannocystis sp.]|jgi:hypothetical protein
MPAPVIDPQSTVRAARDRYLAVNGFSIAGYTEPTFTLTFLGRQITLPNPPARQAAIARHDIHHVLVGYDTDLAGEAEIGVWELRGGCPTAFLLFINGMALLAGIFIAPRRVWRAWQRARGSHTLYVDGLDYEAALDMRVVDLRRRLGLPDEGIVARAG